VPAGDVTLRVCERRLIHRADVSPRARRDGRPGRVCVRAPSRRKVVGTEGGGGRKDNGAAKGPRNGVARRRRWKKAREGSETGDSGEA